MTGSLADHVADAQGHQADTVGLLGVVHGESVAELIAIAQVRATLALVSATLAVAAHR